MEAMKSLTCATALLTSLSAFAQHAHEHASHHEPATPRAQQKHAPYAGMQNRNIKALSEQQVKGIRAGKGMSLALPAELNGYPGPLHTLEMADRLDLSDEQRRKTSQLFAAMQREAKALGDRLLAAEAELDRLFRNREATPESVENATLRAAHAQARLRAAHLRYHLHMADVLSPAQTATYNRLRGYERRLTSVSG
jgi:Spy/CpxP family protein refolding chaperone